MRFRVLRLVVAVAFAVVLGHCREAGEADQGHPHLARSPWPIIHHSPAQEASSPFAGPDGAAGGGLAVDFLPSVQGPASVLFDSQGRLLVMGVDFFDKKHVFMRLDPETLERIDGLEIDIESPLEGLYSFVDSEDCWWNGHAQAITRLCSDSGTLREDVSFDLLELRPDLMSADDSIIGLMPLVESSGRIDVAFVTTGLKPVHEGGQFTKVVIGAKVGVLRVRDDGGGDLVVNSYGDENITNNPALDPAGNLYVLTNKQALKLRLRDDAGGGAELEQVWSVPYDSGPPIPSFPCDDDTSIDACELLSRQADVKFADGSGTTPTLLGAGLAYVAFADGGRPLRVVVLRTADGSAVDVDVPRPFADPEAQTENTITAYGGRFAIENNSGKGAAAFELSGDGGAERARLLWVDDEIFAPNAVPLVSGASGALYLYEMRGDSPWAAESEWFVTALDLGTGRLLWRRLAGAGLDYNSVYAPLCIDDRKRMYIGLFGGLLRIREPSTP
jgi:outer membrane protein assembly factor BamB